MEIKNIAVHHFGDKGAIKTLSQLNNAHRARWPEFPSKLRPDLWVGYNFVIWKDGTYLQARYIGEETAAQRRFNLDTVSICLHGDFGRGLDVPTEAQKATLKWLINVIVGGNAERNGLSVLAGTQVSIDPSRVFPHRHFQDTECYGNGLADDWARLVAFPPEQPKPVPPLTPAAQSEGVKAIWERIRVLQLMIEVLKLKELLDALQQKRLGSTRHSCWDNARG